MTRPADLMFQNVTSGPATDAMRAAALVLTVETDPDLLARTMPDHEVWSPARNPRMAVAWNPDLFKMNGDPTYVQAHPSAASHNAGCRPADRWNFRTPGRGPLTWRGHWTAHPEHRAGGVVDHWINDWTQHPDREHVVETYSIPATRDALATLKSDDRLRTATGDYNGDAGWAGPLPGMVRLGPPGGHDHAFLDRRNGLTCEAMWETPRTGVGTTFRHKGIAIVLGFPLIDVAHRLAAPR